VALISLAIAARPAAAQAVAANAADTSTGVSEVVVTATKRSENIMRVPAPVSAVTGQQLERSNANSLADYITRMPGVAFNDYQPGVSEVVIRGIAATTYHEQGQTTVGYYLNEVTLVEPGFPIGIPDIDTFDLNRVEVLRGPQGTLFGSSTLGGSVNYVVNVADPHKFDLAAEGLVGGTDNADQANYAGKVMANIPIITDKLAVRIVGLQRFDAGYLDNIGVSPEDKGSNSFRTRGVRASVVFEPVDGTKITYLGAYQDTKLDDQTYVTTFGTYDRSTGRLEPQTTSFFLNSLRLDQKLGDIGTLTVLGSTDVKENYTLFTDPYGYVTGVTAGPNVAYDYTHAHAAIDTIEARIASNDEPGSKFRWLVGVSYEHATKYSFDQLFAPGAEQFITNNPGQFSFPASVLAPNDRVYGYLSNTTNNDLGVFGEATYRFSPLFDITVGGRYFDTEAEGDVTNYAGFVSGSPVNLSGHVDQKENGFTPKVTLALHPMSDVLAYFTYSRGYRVGGINPNAGLLKSIPTAYHSDTVDNLEGGVKATLLGGRLLLDETVFDEMWNKIQARLFGPAPEFYSYVTNASAANVFGSEFSGTYRITQQLTFSTSFTYEDAHLTKFLPDTFAVGGGYPSGSILPGSSKYSWSNNLSYDFELPWHPTLELAHRYLSRAPVAFGNPNSRGEFNIFDARLGFDLGNNVRLLGFVDNMLNRYGILNAPFTSQAAPAYSIVRPRTFGLRVDWKL
jgi:outer membrane receptor protein involved in Fe transport